MTLALWLAPFGPARAQDPLDAQRSALRPEFHGPSLDEYPRYRIVATANLEDALLYGQVQVLFRNPSAEPLGTLAFRLLPNARSI